VLPSSSFQSLPTPLKLTGVLGLAVALLWSAGRGRPPPPRKRGEEEGGGDDDDAPSSSAPPPPPLRPATATPSALRAALGGARVVCVSAPGVVLAEGDGEPLESGATLLPGATAALTALASAVDRVYLIARVAGDVGEAAARGALEAAACVGPRGAAPVPPHRLLFCDTEAGKVAAVRALGVGLHIDADGATLAALARFVPRLARVGPPGGGGEAWPVAGSLAGALGV